MASPCQDSQHPWDTPSSIASGQSSRTESPIARQVVDHHASLLSSSIRARQNTASSMSAVRRLVEVFCCHNRTFLREASRPVRRLQSVRPRMVSGSKCRRLR
jgi:hypothetical protein